MTYTYQPLDYSKGEIRLLELQPGEPGSAIEFYLHVVSLDERPLYEAVSYVWGNQYTTKPVYVLQSNSNGQEVHAAPLNVTVNLESALCHLRYPDESRMLWADAICINQNENVEKGAQVQRMGEIFEIAARVCVWLGDEDPASFSKDAMELMAQCPENMDAAYELFADENWSLSWRALTALVQRPYFGRCWIIQEIAFASDVSVDRDLLTDMLSSYT